MTTMHAPDPPAFVRPPEPAKASAPRSPRAADERQTLLDQLDDPVGWSAAAASLLADLGFRLISDPKAYGTSHLLVAIRDRPTLAHFDPEDVAYFAMTGTRGALVRVDRRMIDEPGEAFATPALWGHVHVIDRVPVENRFLTFGGTLRGAVIDDDLAVLDLLSPAPIVRWGGHSQGVDPLTDAIGAFFGRLIVPVDFQPGAEARIDALAPGALYCAFLLDWSRRLEQAERRGFEASSLRPWVATALRRVCADTEAARAANELVRDIELA